MRKLLLTILIASMFVMADLNARATSQQVILDYEVFKTQVQPILTSARKGNARCTACHSRGGGNSYLEALAPGSDTYTEEQSRRNFERVQRLVVPGEPLKSILLVNPLAEEAGGSHWHGGGKHWQSQNDREWQVLASWVRGTAKTSAGAAAGAKPPLNYETFKTRVQPILTSARKGNARCTACHSRGGGNSYLETLAPGSEAYTEEQSQRNFERVQRLVVPGQPLKSLLLINPLAEEAGGSHWHGGGKHWTSQNDPEWKILEAWVRGL
jgi:cytochrome c553